MTKRSGGRQLWLDAAKGIGIILVVFGHATDGLFSAGLLPRSGAMGTAFFVLYTFHMPLFFFLSGLMIPKSLGKGAPVFLKDKLATIAYPYLVWSLIQGTLQLQVASQLNHEISIWSLIAIPWKPMGHFWFLYALMVCHLVSVFLANRPGVALALIPAGFLFSPYAPCPYSALIAYHLPFYISGWMLSSYVMNWRPECRQNALRLVALLFIVFAVAVSFAAFSVGLREYYSWPAIPAAVGGTALVIAITKALELKTSSLIVVLGRCSLAIYLMHVMAVAGMRVILTKSGLVTDPIGLLFLASLCGLVAPLIALQILERFGIAEVFGLGNIHRREKKDARPSLA